MAIKRVQVSMAVDSMLPRDLVVNNLHFDDGGVSISPTSWEDICGDICDLWQERYGSVTGQVTAAAYDIGTPPNFPIAKVTKGVAQYNTNKGPREVALCLSFARNKSIPSQRGRIYLMPGARTGFSGWEIGLRPTDQQMAWALGFFSQSGTGLPDIGGTDLKFGVWSPTTGVFHQASLAWCDDEWDTVRRRGLRATTRQTSVREG
jgi:hypothetical protein